MERGSRSTRNQNSYADALPEEDGQVDRTGPGRESDEVDPADFGMASFRRNEGTSRPPGAFGSSLVGTGPNGTRSFLKGWFGLDEPTSAGYNTRPDLREKSVNGDVLPMRATNGQYTEELHPHIPVVPTIGYRPRKTMTGRLAHRAQTSDSLPPVSLSCLSYFYHVTIIHSVPLSSSALKVYHYDSIPNICPLCVSGHRRRRFFYGRKFWFYSTANKSTCCGSSPFTLCTHCYSLEWVRLHNQVT
ncbi:hypothetical protein PSHT_09885 [Puccinia striiformis]|uniref:Uncharacterized protein n=1 Tax=Puccinia striiformis TaxID=27350 RepID=A0A2S4VDL8_9BASI|nr:hypothetical protein PSHT_09885 [Puccinia striiformis]